MSDELKKHLHTVSSSIYEAKLYFTLWWVLCGKDTRPNYVDIMNEYVQVFAAIIGASWTAAVSTMHKVIEERKNTYNIWNLLNDLERDSRFCSDEIKAYKVRIKNSKATIKGVKIIRNHVISHNSKILQGREAYKAANMILNKAMEFLNNLISIIDEIYDRLNISTRPYIDDAPKEMERLLQDLISFHKNKNN